MNSNVQDFFWGNPEEAIIVVLDSQQDGFLRGALERHGGKDVWLDYTLEFHLDCDIVSLYRDTEDIPVMVYRVMGRHIDIEKSPEYLLILCNLGQYSLKVDGDSLFPREMLINTPEVLH